MPAALRYPKPLHTLSTPKPTPTADSASHIGDSDTGMGSPSKCGQKLESGSRKAPKPKTCKVCRTKFIPFRSTQPTCGAYDCNVTYGLQVIAKNDAAKARKEAKALREAKEAAKPRGKWLKEAQAVFNRFIRLRDANKPCISCDRVSVEMTVGGAWDCGHFLSVGSHPELRFDENNAAKQCKTCNGGAGKYAKKNHTVSQSYRVNLIERIGLEAVEQLEGPHEPKKYSIEDLRQIKATYATKCRELEAK